MWKNLNDVSVVLFDWGGTLCSVRRQVATFVSCASSACEAAKEADIALPPGASDRLLSLLVAAHERSESANDHPEMRIEPVIASWLSAEETNDVDERIVAQIGQAFWRRWVGCLDVIGRADEVLRELRRRGYRLGLVSNVATPPAYCFQELERLGLRASFEAFAFSSEVGHRKPHPAMYQRAIDQINRDGRAMGPERMLFVGDNPAHDVAIPARMGMKTALLPDKAGLWNPKHHAGAQADLRIETVANLLEALRGV